MLPRSGLSAQVYEPGTGVRRTVVFVHGMTHEGPEDPRVVGLASALAATGTRVVVPLLPEVAEARIELESVGRVAAAAADASHLAGRTVGLLGAWPPRTNLYRPPRSAWTRSPPISRQP